MSEVLQAKQVHQNYEVEIIYLNSKLHLYELIEY